MDGIADPKNIALGTKIELATLIVELPDGVRVIPPIDIEVAALTVAADTVVDDTLVPLIVVNVTG